MALPVLWLQNFLYPYLQIQMNSKCVHSRFMSEYKWYITFWKYCEYYRTLVTCSEMCFSLKFHVLSDFHCQFCSSWPVYSQSRIIFARIFIVYLIKCCTILIIEGTRSSSHFKLAFVPLTQRKKFSFEEPHFFPGYSGFYHRGIVYYWSQFFHDFYCSVTVAVPTDSLVLMSNPCLFYQMENRKGQQRCPLWLCCVRIEQSVDNSELHRMANGHRKTVLLSQDILPQSNRRRGLFKPSRPHLSHRNLLLATQALIAQCLSQHLCFSLSNLSAVKFPSI